MADSDLIVAPGFGGSTLPQHPWTDEVGEALNIKEKYVFDEFASPYGGDWISTRSEAYKLGNLTNTVSASLEDPQRCIRRDDSDFSDTNTVIRSGSYSINLCIKYVDLLPAGYIPVYFYPGYERGSTVAVHLCSCDIRINGFKATKVYSKPSTGYNDIYCVKFTYGNATYMQSLVYGDDAKNYALTPKIKVEFEIKGVGFVLSESVEFQSGVKKTTLTHGISQDICANGKKSWHHGLGVVYMPKIASNASGSGTIVAIHVSVLFTATKTDELDPDYSNAYLVRYKYKYTTSTTSTQISPYNKEFPIEPFEGLLYGGPYLKDKYTTTTGARWIFYGANPPKKVVAGAFANDILLEYIDLSAVQLCEYDAITSISPSTITEIGNQAFYGCTSLTGMIVPESVTSVGKQAFQGCISMKSISFGSKISSIGESICENCTSLGTVTFDSTNKVLATIPKRTFYGCSALERVYYPGNVTTIGSYAFYSCTKYDFCIPNTCVTLQDYCFSRCLQSLANFIPSSVKTIKNNAFDTTTFSLSSGNLMCMPNTVTNFEESIYENAKYTGNPTLYISDGITRIPNKMFNINWFFFGYCDYSLGYWADLSHDGLTDIRSVGDEDRPPNMATINGIRFPNSLTSIGYNAFSLLHFAKLSLNNTKVSSIGNEAFYTNGLLTTCEFPPCISSVNDRVFCECYKLTTVTNLEKIQHIGNSCFYECPIHLDNVYLEATQIGAGAFAGEDYLKKDPDDIKLPNLQALSSNVFEGRYIGQCHVGPNCNSVDSRIVDSAIASSYNGTNWFFYSKECKPADNINKKFLGSNLRCTVYIPQSTSDYNYYEHYTQYSAWNYYLKNHNHYGYFDPYLNHYYAYVVPCTNGQYQVCNIYNPRYYRIQHKYLPVITKICKGEVNEFIGGVTISADGTTVTIGGDGLQIAAGTYEMTNTTWYRPLTLSGNINPTHTIDKDLMQKIINNGMTLGPSFDPYTYNNCLFINILTKIN